MIEHFHFLRPWWLLLLIPMCVLLWLMVRGRYDSGNWRTVIDARLLPFVLSGARGPGRNGMRYLMATVASLAIIALAGPTWEKLPQPVYQKESALVIMLDLSRSMNAADIKPSRLVRARHKIADILNLRIEGQTALVVYAADAFSVTPLTTDVDTIMALLPDLESSLMPAQGSRADRAFELAFGLLETAGAERGDLLLVSDGVDDRTLQRIEALHAENPGQRFSALAVGTPDGGPVPLPGGGFLKSTDGSIVISRLREQNLRRIARNGGGVYATISTDDIDINTLAYLMESGIDARESRRAADRSAEVWREFGPWLLLVALPFASLAFRRGVLWLLPLWIVALPPDAQAFDWRALWQNDDQRASELFERGDHATAAEMFENPEWRAAAQYRVGNYDAALDTWRGLESEDVLYNRGNALARLGRYEDALDAYDSLLAKNPAHEDALHNKRAIEEFLRRQQRKQQQDQRQRETRQDEQQQDQQEAGQSRPGEENAEQQQGQSPGEGGQRDTDGGAQDESGQTQAGRQPDDPQSRQLQETAPQKQAGGESTETGEAALARIDEQMSTQAAEQWLRKIPDDPGGLLRRKFRYQYRERGGVDVEAESW